MYYTTWSPVRGGCGHLHRSCHTARLCAKKDQRRRRKSRGSCFDDRKVRRVASRSELHEYHDGSGPGEIVWPNNEDWEFVY